MNEMGVIDDDDDDNDDVDDGEVVLIVDNGGPFLVVVPVVALVKMLLMAELKLHVTGLLSGFLEISKLGLLMPCPVSDVGVISK